MAPLSLNITEPRLLVIDPSANHLAYVIVNNQTIESCGMIWTKDSWIKGKRFSYMAKAIQLLLTEFKVNHVFTEAFFVNPKQMLGSAVIPVINGLIELTSYEHKASYQEITPPSWRAILQIKAFKDDKGKKDYKTPVRNKVIEVLGPIPDKVISNITGKDRDLPHDLTDSLGITLAILNSMNYNNIKLAENSFNNLVINNQLKGIINNE